MPPRIKAPQKLRNLDLPLEHIRSVLGGRYALYRECVTAITRAAKRREDASAWFEQLEQLVDGVDAVAFSHAGLMFLLRESTRSETLAASKMPPPPLPLRTAPFSTTQLPLTMPPQRCTPSFSNAPASITSLKNPSNDPIFFTDPRFKFEVNNFWENPTGSQVDFTGSSAVGYNINSSYNTPNDFIPRYVPTDDDFKIYHQHGQRFAKDINETSNDGSEPESLEKAWRRRLELLLME